MIRIYFSQIKRFKIRFQCFDLIHVLQEYHPYCEKLLNVKLCCDLYLRSEAGMFLSAKNAQCTVTGEEIERKQNEFENLSLNLRKVGYHDYSRT